MNRMFSWICEYLTASSHVVTEVLFVTICISWQYTGIFSHTGSTSFPFVSCIGVNGTISTDRRRSIFTFTCTYLQVPVGDDFRERGLLLEQANGGAGGRGAKRGCKW